MTAFRPVLLRLAIDMQGGQYILSSTNKIGCNSSSVITAKRDQLTLQLNIHLAGCTFDESL